MQPIDLSWSLDREIQQVHELLSASMSLEERLQAVCEHVHKHIPRCDWVGFYFIHPDKERVLLLGPFVGEPTEHNEIPFGKGICGQVAESLQTYTSDDVSKESNYIACSLTVRSEIVVPILKEGRFWGQLDIDSHAVAAFGAQHQQFCEAICKRIAHYI